MIESRNGRSTLAAAAALKSGSVLRAAAAIKVHPNTLYKAVAGVSVSEETRAKIEAAFSSTLEELQEPLPIESGV